MNLTGPQSSPIKRPGLAHSLLGRPLKENAFIEVTNLLAENPIPFVSMPQIAEILARYDLGFGESRQQFLNLFRRVLLSKAADRELSPEEQTELSHLQMILELPGEEAQKVREDALADLFANSLADALGDGHISPEKRQRLDAIAASFNLPESRRSEIYTGQVQKLLQWRASRIGDDATGASAWLATSNAQLHLVRNR